ncbi:MAG TPA: IclR family transcriptional regulator [Xanthobacteraceae bacterium]|jgi:DNA-binding IclR family transcriptional regulator
MKGTTSLKRILAVLEVFSEKHLEWTPEELLAELGYSRPTLYRYLKYLKEAGFLISTPGAGFTLGPKVVELDYLMRKADSLVLNGTPYLKGLTATYPCTALLVRWYGNKILCVASETSTVNPVSSYPRGRPMSLGRGAIPRSIMAFLPRARLMPLIAENLTDLRAVGLGATPDEIYARMRQVRRAGFAIAHGEVTPGAIGIAAPVLGDGKHPIASLCVTIAGHAVTGTQLDTIGERVRNDALAIGAAADPPAD